MRVLIVGSRGIQLYSTVEAAIAASRFEVTSVITGSESGCNELVMDWAWEHRIPWKRILISEPRNDVMGAVADAAIIITNGSRGAKCALDVALELLHLVYVYDTRL